MSDSETTTVTKEKIKRKRTDNHQGRVKWTETMEKLVLEFGRANLLRGKGFEKPTAPEYYRKFLEDADPALFGDVTVNKLLQHMKVLKGGYTLAIDWRSKTGEGILLEDSENGATTVEQGLLKRCKYFHQFDELLGDKPQFKTPHVHHVGTMPEKDNESDAIEQDHTNNLNAETVSEENTKTDQEAGFDTPKASKLTKRSPLRKRLRRTPIKSAEANLEKSIRLRTELEEKRLSWEMKREDETLKTMQLKHERDMEMQEKRLQFDQKKWEDECMQKKTEEDHKYELEKLRIQNQLFMEKLKLQKDFELEKIRITK